jgi:K+-sensing histidine kinase KdpD
MAFIAAKSSESPASDAESRAPTLGRAAGQYGAAVAAIAVALAARVLMTPIVQDETTYLFFVPAVLIAAGGGGFLPGLLATGLGVLLGYFFIPSFPTLSPAEILNAAAFIAIGLGMACVAEEDPDPEEVRIFHHSLLSTACFWRLRHG